MDSETTYEVVIKRDVYEVMSANTEFYAFMGSRIYCTFDRLIRKTEGIELGEYLASGSHVLLDLVTEEGAVLRCLTTVAPGDTPEQISLRMVVLDELLGRELFLRNSLARQYAVLELYNDYYFEYNAGTDLMRVYTVHRCEKEILSLTLEEFEQKLRLHNGGQHSPEVEKLMLALRSGSRRFEILAPGNLLNTEDASLTLIKGVSCYREAEYLYAAGYIHLGNERNENAKKEPERDFLTGVLAKSEITHLAVSTIDVQKVSDITIAIIDIDYFKTVNDVYGHKEGDTVLKKVASIIEYEVGDTGVVGRIGGDEFLVLFYHAYDMENMRERLRSIKNKVSSTFAKNEKGEGIGITLSLGCAAYPKDADNYEDLFTLADFALYRAKERGRNRYVIYDAEKHGSLAVIQGAKTPSSVIARRNNMSPEELLCFMMDTLYSGSNYPLESLLNDIVTNFEIPRVVVYAGPPYKIVGMCGAKILPPRVIQVTQDYPAAPFLQGKFDKKQTLVIDNTAFLEASHPDLYDKLCRQSILSLIQIKFKDKNGNDAILSLEAVNKKVTWNCSLLPCYRLLAKMLSEYALA